MKDIIVLLVLLIASGRLEAQSDQIPSENGPIIMTPILHSSLVLQWDQTTIYIDPYGGPAGFAGFVDPDIICITHAHGDHMNPETLQGLALSKAVLVAPQSVVDKLGDLKFKAVKVLQNGEDFDLIGINVLAVPMYNLPEDNTSRHEKGWGNGYVLTIDGKRFYISGDTEDILEMRDLADIDYAFVCMNLPYTMTVEQAADAVLDFKPKTVYPFHYRGADGFSDVKAFKELVEAQNQNIEVRLREWYPKSQ